MRILYHKKHRSQVRHPTAQQFWSQKRKRALGYSAIVRYEESHDHLAVCIVIKQKMPWLAARDILQGATP